MAGEAPVTRTVSSPRLPVSVLETHAELGGSRIAHRNATLPDGGAWIAAVWLHDQASAFAPGSFLQSAQTNCGVAVAKEVVTTVPLSRRMLGGGLFDLDGNLLALILPCDDRIAAIQADSVEQMIATAGAVQERVLAQYGLLIGSLSQDDRRYFKDVNGLIVREVWTPTEGDARVLSPGDIVMALNGRPVTSVEDLRPLATGAGGPSELRVQRGAKTTTLTVNAGTAPGVAAPESAEIGLASDSAPRGFRIDSVQSAGRMARAGLRAGDRLVRINGAEPRNPRHAERVIAAVPGPMLLDIERDGRRIAIVVP